MHLWKRFPNRRNTRERTTRPQRHLKKIEPTRQQRFTNRQRIFDPIENGDIKNSPLQKHFHVQQL
jgi:hypothetical protein